MTINNSTIAGNIAGGPTSLRGYAGGITSYQGLLTITNSTISGNMAGGGHEITGRCGINVCFHYYPWASGGGIIISYGTAVIQNSTISGNIANYGACGGFRNIRGNVFMQNVTISNNSADSRGGVCNFAPIGFSMTVSHSLIAGNIASLKPEIENVGMFVADDFNVFGSNGDVGSYGVTPGATDIIPNVQAKDILGPLQDNGGPTLTHALVPGSPALDALPIDVDCAATDQRGVARPQGTGCDIGAVEGVHVDPPPPLPQLSTHNFVITSVQAPKSIKHGGGTAPVTVTIRNASIHSETLSGSSVLGDGAKTGLVRLDIAVVDTDGEQCEPAAVSLDGAKNAKLFGKGPKVLAPGTSLAVNFLVTYRCDAALPVNKRSPEAGDYTNRASVFPDELDGISDSNASSTLPGVATKVTR